MTMQRTSYTPRQATAAELPSDDLAKQQEAAAASPQLIDVASKRRLDERKLNQLRPVYFTVGMSSRAAGSAYMEIGGTKVMCTVHEPSASSSDLREYSDIGTVSIFLHPVCFALSAAQSRLIYFAVFAA